jgi:aspartate aminotransferase
MIAQQDIIDLSVGQPDFPTPDAIKAAGKRAIDENYTRYTPQPGFQDLREAIVRKFERENGFCVSPEQVVVSCGAKHSLFNAIHSIVRPGDEVIILTPHWYAYPIQVRHAGGRPVLVPTREEDGFQPRIDAIRAAVTPATRALILNTPCNPTGAVYDRQRLIALAELAVEHDLWVISDEVYETIVFDGARHVSIASLGERIARRTITVNSVSKTHSMTGWRIGYAAMPAEIAAAATELQSFSTSGPCALSQRAALAALTEEPAHVEAMRLEYANRRRYVLQRLAALPELRFSAPQGTFYLFLNISAFCGRTLAGRPVGGSEDFAKLLLETAGVKVIPGLSFGSDQHVRLSFAASLEAIEEGMNRIERLIGSGDLRPPPSDL